MGHSSRTDLIIGFLSIGVALASYRFVALGLENAFPGMELHLQARQTVFLLHVGLAPVALAIGVFQFIPSLRTNMPGLHRWSGRIYTFAILVSGFAALTLAIGSIDRPVAASGFGLLAVLWLGTTVRAVHLVMTGRVREHRLWMIRSFALTFAAVTLRLQLPFFGLLGMNYIEASHYLAWTCWVPNFLFAEWYIRKTTRDRTAPAV